MLRKSLSLQTKTNEIMKKWLLVPCALLFSLSMSCSSRRHIEQQQGSHMELSQGMLAECDSTSIGLAERDTTSLSAALHLQQMVEGRSTEVDTSRTVIVTEFGDNGQPIRQTETRQNGIARSGVWTLEQQLQIDAYLLQMRELNEQYDASVRMLMAMRNASRADTLSYEAEREPNVLPASVKWVAGIEIALAWIVVLSIGVALIMKKMKCYK